MKVRFYTYAPIEYPFILRNIKQKPLDWFLHEIVDIGIYDLLKEPYQHSEKKLKKWKNLVTPGWKVVPDCPDIDKEFKIKSGIDNVKYSKELLLEYYDPKDESQLPVIQGNYDNPFSFRKYCVWFISQFEEPKKIGLGTICKSGDKQAVKETGQIARKYFPNSWIHIFGLKMNHYPVVAENINSWDSMSWTFPRGVSGRKSAGKIVERQQYFAEYIEAIPDKKKASMSLENIFN